MKKIISILSISIMTSVLLSQNVDTLQMKANNQITNDSLANLIHEKLPISSDSLATLIDEKVNQVLREVFYVDPLEGKVGGFEINPFLILFSLAGDGVWLSGGYSRFDINEDAEIAFPFTIMIGGGNSNSLFIVDYQYRLFMGRNTPHEYRSGFYLMSGLRTAFHENNYEDNLNGFNLGVTFGFGSRKFGKTGWYWGWSIYGGRYLTSEFPIINIEFFKFGKTF